MPDAVKKKKIWIAYSCPVCRFVFRVPKDRNGQGVICPACQYLVKVPLSADQSHRFKANNSTFIKHLPAEPREKKKNKPILARKITEQDALIASDKSETLGQETTGRHKYHRQKSTEEIPTWEREDNSSQDEKSTLWVLIGAVMGLAVIGTVVWLVIGSSNSQSIVVDSHELALRSKEREDSKNKVKLTAEEQNRNRLIQESVNTSKNFMKESEKVIKAFLNAKKESDLYSLVRNPKETIPKIKQWYTDERPWKPVGVRKIREGLKFSVEGVMGVVSVRLDDYSLREIVLERTSNGYLVDWESWAAWTSMPWKDLFKKKPSEPVVVRAICSLDNYYNHDFKDEKKWVVVRMDYPSADKVLYGYIDANVEQPSLKRLLDDVRQGKKSSWTLGIRYPKDAKFDNQVLIEECINKGWVNMPKGSVDKKEN